MTEFYKTRSSRDEYYDWVAGRGPHKINLITRHTLRLDAGEEKKILDIDGREGDIRFFMIEVSSASNADNVRLTIETDCFYFSMLTSEMMNYNIDKYPNILPSVLVADPVVNRYVIIFKPYPPEHFINTAKITVSNEDSSASVNVVYSIAYSEVTEQ